MASAYDMVVPKVLALGILLFFSVSARGLASLLPTRPINVVTQTDTPTKAAIVPFIAHVDLPDRPADNISYYR